MEYLESINDKLKKINDTNIQYLNLFNHPSLVFGNVDKSKVDFHKYSKSIEEDIRRFGGKAQFFLQYHNTSSCGNRIRFKTTSRKIVLKVQLKRGYAYKNMNLWNSSGFDIYIVDNKGNYESRQLIAPSNKNRIFAEEIWLPPNSSVCIFLPNYDTIEKMYIGIQLGSRIANFPYKKNHRKPILFYGNGITQGASASKSGNSFPNIVSRKLDHDIINMSVDNACKATYLAAQNIGKIDCDSIVLDYSRDANVLSKFASQYKAFYKFLRDFHPEKKIILMTTVNLNDEKKYHGFDEVIIKTYEDALKRGENTLLLNQSKLFDENERDLVTVDDCHYNDFGMYKVAEKICELLNS